MNLTLRLRAATDLDLGVATVERAVRERMRAVGAGIDYDPQPGTPEFDALVDLVVVPESWILRDPAVFETALRFVQTRLLTRPGRQVRVLSLPCAGGEEPYSLAMLLAHAGIEPEHCRIDAFDLSRAAIARARAGRYTRNAFRGDDQGLRARFFTEDGDEQVIGAAPRAYVAFVQANLFDVDPAVTGTYDLVFCRNLLIYFDLPTQQRAAARLAALLADDGLLLAGYAEAPALCRAGFAPRTPHDTFALGKHGRRAADVLRAPPRPAARPAPRPSAP
ncbi:CheR family methyltransferase, partial [Telluria sp. Tellsp131]